MIDYIFLFLMLLALFAAVLRADFVLTIIYMLLGVYFIGRWWSQRALGSVTAVRTFSPRAFMGEKIPVRLEIRNNSWLPVVWLQYHESRPVELSLRSFLREVISLDPHERKVIDYELEGRKRGYYPVGPLVLHSGDLFGIAGVQERRVGESYLTVYPKIVPLTRVVIPTSSPLGTMRHNQPIFEDPSRVLGKRDYTTGDSLRRVDWKATAAAGRLQVKLFEPSIALETAIFLDLNAGEYNPRHRYDSTELAIVVAASLANWVIAQRQAVGLLTNGADPLAGGEPPQPVYPRRGRGQLIRILEVLARIQAADTYPLVESLERETVRLSWGTTLIVITPCLDETLFKGLFHARRAGLNAALIPCGTVSGSAEARQRAQYFGFPYYPILAESDLDLWRR